MKIILLFLSLVLVSISTQAQLKVISSGDVETPKNMDIGLTLDVDGDSNLKGSLNVGALRGASPSYANIGKFRTLAGNSGFNIFSTSGSSTSFRLISNVNGVPRFQNFETTTMAFDNMEASDIRFRTDNTTRMTITAAGGVAIGGTLTVQGQNVTSDKRLKKGIKKFDKGLKEVLKINPVAYQYNGKGGTTSGIDYVGVLAQDLEKIVPEFVSDHNVDIYDESTGLKSGKETFLQIHDSQIKYLLINAIQDQQEIIDNQNKVLAEQQSKIDEIESILKELLSNDINKDEVILEGSSKQPFLGQNAPNPFANNTVIEYNVPESSSAKLNFVDLTGNIIMTKDIVSGKGKIDVNVNDMPSGVYGYQLIIDGKLIDTKKMVLQK